MTFSFVKYTKPNKTIHYDSLDINALCNPTTNLVDMFITFCAMIDTLVANVTFYHSVVKAFKYFTFINSDVIYVVQQVYLFMRVS